MNSLLRLNLNKNKLTNDCLDVLRNFRSLAVLELYKNELSENINLAGMSLLRSLNIKGNAVESIEGINNLSKVNQLTVKLANISRRPL